MTKFLQCMIFTISLCEVSHGYRITYSSSSGLYTESDDVQGYTSGNNAKVQFLSTQYQRNRQPLRQQPRHTSGSDNKRITRGASQQEISFERRQPECITRLQQQSFPKGPANVAIYVEVGETTSFTCHYCGDKTTKYASMVWKRMKRGMMNGHVQVMEVEPDMHDDETKNRITVGKDHTLTIRDARLEDQGVYFCQNFSKDDVLIKKWMNTWLLHILSKDTTTFRFHYNFDIIRPTDMKIREVSPKSGKKSMAPLEPYIYEDKNMMMVTTWQKWGQCSTCGQPGVRKRLGACTMKRHDNKRRIEYYFAESLMTTYRTGLPCRLTVFSYLPDSLNRPDEMEEEACNITCPLGANLFKSRSMSVDGIKTSINFDKEQKKHVKLRALTVSEGVTVNMSCPGVPVDWAVVWTNNSRIVDVNVTGSGARMTLHVDNVLEINDVAAWDSATYRCVSRDQVKATVKLTVTPRIVADTATWLFAYFTSLTYPADLLLFLFLMVVKHRHRRAGRRLTNIQLREIESFSSMGSRRSRRQYLSSQTDASRRYLSSQNDTSRRYLSSQTDASRRYISYQTDASRRYLSSTTYGSRRYGSSETDASSRRPISSKLVNDVLEEDSLLSSDSEIISYESERILANDVITASPRTHVGDPNSDSASVSEIQSQWGVNRRHNRNVNRYESSTSSSTEWSDSN